MQKVDWRARNQKWSAQWGHPVDPKSVKIVEVSQEEREEMEHAQVCLPIGPGAHDLIREELRKEMQFVGRLIKAVENDTLDKLEEELEREDKSEVAKNEKSSRKPKVDMAVIKSQIEQEDRILDQLSDEESTEVEICKLCYHPKYVDGQVGIHHCS